MYTGIVDINALNGPWLQRGSRSQIFKIRLIGNTEASERVLEFGTQVLIITEYSKLIIGHTR